MSFLLCGLVAIATRKAVVMAEQFLTPLTSRLPSALPSPTAVAVAVLISVCLVAGLLMRTRAGKGLEKFFRNILLNHVPGYALARSAVRGIAKVDDNR